MSAITVFKENIQNAHHLLRLFQILHSERKRPLRPERKRKLANIFRKSVGDIRDIADNQFLQIIILNDPESPRREFFQKHELSFLLRQALVAACSALDSFFQELYEENCYKAYSLIEKRIRSLNKNKFKGNEEKIKALKKSAIFKQGLTMRHYLAISQYSGKRKGHAIRGAILSSRKNKSTQGPGDISDLFKNLDIKSIFSDIAKNSKTIKKSITSRLETINKRRNLIIHFGDRPIRTRKRVRKPQRIDYQWVKDQVSFIEGIPGPADQVVSKHVNKNVPFLLKK